jgi:hypothetical protein
MGGGLYASGFATTDEDSVAGVQELKGDSLMSTFRFAPPEGNPIGTLSHFVVGLS